MRVPASVQRLINQGHILDIVLHPFDLEYLVLIKPLIRYFLILENKIETRKICRNTGGIVFWRFLQCYLYISLG